MCTMIVHQAKIEGRGKNGTDWFEVREANVSYDHPYDCHWSMRSTLISSTRLRAGSRVAVELSVEAAREPGEDHRGSVSSGRGARCSGGHKARGVPLKI